MSANGNNRTVNNRNSLTWVAALLLSGLFFNGPCSATSVVVFWTDKEAFLGTDSRRTKINVGLVDTCKLEQAGGVYFAIDGITSMDPSLDGRAIAAEIMVESGSIDERVERFRQRMTSLLPASIHNLQGKSMYIQWLKNKDYVFGATFVGVERGRPRVIVCRFRLHPNGDGYSEIKPEKEMLTPWGFHYYAASVGTWINVEAAAQLYQDKGPAQAIDQLIRAAVVLYPEAVGNPVSIVRAGLSGTTGWVQRGLCDERSKATKR